MGPDGILLGIGQALPAQQQQQEQLRALVAAHLQRRDPPLPGWQLDQHGGLPAGTELLVFQQASVVGLGTLNGTGYGRAKSRVSHYALARCLTSGGRPVERVVRLEGFLLARQGQGQGQGQSQGQGSAAPPPPPPPPLRLALCSVFATQRPWPAWPGLVRAEASPMEDELRALGLADMLAQLASSEPQLPTAQQQQQDDPAAFTDHGAIYFMPYFNRSRRL